MINQFQMFLIVIQKNWIVSEISIKYDLAHMGMLRTYHIPEFVKVQHLWNESRDETDCLYAQIFREANIWFKHVYWVCSDMPRYFQKYTQGTFKMRSWHCVSRISEGIKKGLRMWRGIYRSGLLIQGMSRTI